MTIQSRVARLDDASGELGLSLRKLEMEAAQGTASTDEQIGFLHDLHRAVVSRELRPWLLRAERAALAGLVLLIAALLLPAGLADRDILFPSVAGLGGVALLAAATFGVIYVRALQREHRWLQHEEAAVLGGHPLLGHR